MSKRAAPKVEEVRRPTSYGLVQQVLAGCSQVGLYKVDLAISQKD